MNELMNNKKIEVSLASTNINKSQKFINSVESDCFKLVVTKDIIGVQISAIIKNICAITDGLGKGFYNWFVLPLPEKSRFGVPPGGQ